VQEARQEVEMLELRLDRQVLVDQEIEKDLQERIRRLEKERRALKEEVRVIHEEFEKLEDENYRLRKENMATGEKNTMLEKIVYGKSTVRSTSQQGSGARKNMAIFPQGTTLLERKKRKSKP